MLQIPAARSHEMSSSPSLNNARFSPYPNSPSPQPQALFPLNTTLTGTPIPGSPSSQHLDAAQFRVLMNEATNRIKALAEVEYVPMPQPTPLTTNSIELMYPSPATLANTHNVPRVYLRRSHSVESLVAESVWSTNAEQIGQLDSTQLLYQQQQHLQHIEQQQQHNQQHQQFDYPMPSAMTTMPTGDINQLNQLGMHMVQMNMGLMNNVYDSMAVLNTRASGTMPMSKGMRNRRPLSACSYTSTASPSFSAPSTTSPSPILHSTTSSSFATPINRKHQSCFPNIKTDITLAGATHSQSTSAFSTTTVPRLQSSSLPKTRPKSLPNKAKSGNNNRDDNTTRAYAKPKGEHKPPINRFVCPLPGCGRTFSRPFNLKSHGMTHETRRPYGCDQCDKTFARIHDRDRHLKGHLIEKAHFCVVCLGRFARQDAVTRHLKLAKEKNPCAVILKEHGASFRDAAAGRVLRSQLGDEMALRRRFQELEEDAKKIKATKSLEKGMLSMHLLTLNSQPPLNIPMQKHQQLQLQTALTPASLSPPTPQLYIAGRTF
ncbi:hypothetical protein BGZ95_006969 [Linnemannia exigua]|uniref:C2H2-type domain-containing protein n=1 Tax=Linnemannia exigua TaxID=604196 RepID=A0AAD4DFN4_9FUNG|nr:hypothetical protein BGZ95_006969 [Linnemannia exigua]